MSIQTRSQKFAQAAYSQISEHIENGSRKPDKEFVSIVKKFPALIHTCGLAQAVAFYEANEHSEYLERLANVLNRTGYVDDADSLGNKVRESKLQRYILLSRHVINAASWLKRYVEVAEGEN